MDKLNKSIKSNQKNFDNLVDFIGTDGWEAKLLEFKKEYRKPKVSENKTVSDVRRILRKYNDKFSNLVLDFVKSKEKELIGLGVIEQFKK